ncbi:MAG TPA: hypothetical protein VGB63_13930 [Pedobacter sp.]|jgi:hypothetical protein
MTFEEFFIKKKIDLAQLEKTEPVLYTEFKSHFVAMGEKSFDHTKKFWFNKLRRLYHLTPPEKAITQVETAIASQAEPLSSPTIEQKPAFTPRFKSANTNKVEPAGEEQIEEKSIVKPAFKPRNIPSKPTDLPYMDMGEPKVEEIKAEAPTSALPAKAPGFKPRNIKPPSFENSTDANRADSRPGQPAVSETPITNPEKPKEVAQEAYKPKFKLKNIPRSPSSGEEQTGLPVKQEMMPESLPEIQTDSPVESDIERRISSSTDEKTLEQEIQDNDLDLRGSDDANAEEKPKPAYKPKFNLRNMKPKSEE